jgi:hypothetical protein
MKVTSLLLIASLELATTAPAALMNLNYSGSFGPNTTLGGTALGTETPFSIVATFDSASGIDPSPSPGVAVFAASSFTIVLNGQTYTASPSLSLNVLLLDPTSHYNPNNYEAGFYAGDLSAGFNSFYTTAIPTFSALSPTPTVMSGWYENNVTPYTIALEGVTGGLAINDVGTSPFTAEISSVPEPVNVALGVFGVVFAGVAVGRRLRVRARVGPTTP